MTQLDDLDRKILSVLQERGKLSAQELADATGQSSPATCWRRLKSLQEAGFIEGYQAVLDRRKLGYRICAFTHISIERQYKDVIKEIEEKIVARPEVLECYATTGDDDFTLRVVARDIDDYDAFIQNFLFALPGVSRVRSSLALREVKQTGRVPI
ncbi:MAG: Lrp/AsnC family transcriptional regulator [Pseudomonadota bacterium]